MGLQRCGGLPTPGWWQGGEPDSDEADWPSGMKRAAVKACVATYKARIRPLIRNADLYHISVRSGAELMEKGLPVTLSGQEISALIFFEVAR